MDETVAGRLERLRTAWTSAWVEGWSDADRRADLVDLHAWTHAMSSLLAAQDDASELRVPTAACLVREVVEMDLGRTSDVPLAVVPAGVHVVAERSRPGWHLRGVADAVEWPPDAAALLVLAVDEGDNEVVTLVDVGASGVVVEPRDGTAAVRLHDVRVDVDALVHRPDTRAALIDRLTVLRLLDLLDADPQRRPGELALVRAAVRTAGRTAATGTPLQRQHDVSVAAVVATAPGADRDWHRQRLVPLI